MNKFSLFVFASCLITAPLSAITATWDTETISLSTSSGVRNGFTSVGTGPNAGEAIAAWPDDMTGAPYYSIFNNGVWTTGTIPLTVSGGTDSTGISNFVYVSPGPNSGEAIATWINSTVPLTPYYSIYSGSTWTTGQIPLGTSSNSYSDLTAAPGPNSGEITVTWTDDNYAVFSSLYMGGSWTTSAIPLGTSNGSYYISFIASDASSGQMMITWNDISLHVAYYSIYTAGTWSPGALIPLGASTLVGTNVTIAQGPGNGQFIAGWGDRITHAAYCSMYSGGSWTTQAIPLGTSAGVYNDVYISKGPASGQLIATWSDYNDNSAYYSIYSQGSWSTADQIPLDTSSGASLDVDVAYIPSISSVMTTWANTSGSHIPYSSILASPLPNPPTNGSGKKIKDRFALEIDWIHELQWVASSSDEVAGYNIWRNGTLIASNVTETFYKDYNRPQKGSDVYTIMSVNGSGQESSTGLQIVVN